MERGRGWAAVRPALIVLAAVGVLAVAFAVVFPQRTDYLGHYLAGAGGTLLLVAGVLFAGGHRPWWIVAAVAAAVVMGAGTEASVFRLAIFDPVDFANQSLGAVVVGAAALMVPSSRRLSLVLLAGAVLLLGAGFRYAYG
jgi:hypothetical protein